MLRLLERRYARGHRMLEGGKVEVDALGEAAAALDAQRGELEAEMTDKASEVAALQVRALAGGWEVDGWAAAPRARTRMRTRGVG